MVLFPLKALGEEGWKIAAALTARHIGGAVNYMVGSSPCSQQAACAVSVVARCLLAASLLQLLHNHR
jgi:hypothetical protein